MKTCSHALVGFFLLLGLSIANAGFGDSQFFDINVEFGVAEATKVPMSNGLFMVPVKFNGGSEEYYLIVDTGSMITTINGDVAAKLGLRGNETTTLSGVGARTSESSVVNDVRLELPGVTITNARLAVTPGLHLGHNCAGLLGFDILKRMVVQLDYPNHTVKFIDPQRFTELNQIQIPLGLSFNQPKVEISLVSQGLLFTAPVILDTGSFGGIQLAPAFLQQNPNFRLMTTQGGVANGVGGTATFTEGMCPEIRLGDQRMENQWVQVLSHCPTTNGLLGAQALSQYDVTIDVPDGYLLLRPNGHGPINRRDVAIPYPTQAPPTGTSSSVVSISVSQDVQDHRAPDFIEAGGMIIKQVNGAFIITSVDPGEIGAVFGLRVGDAIVQVDGTSLDGLDLAKLHELLAGSVRHITFVRDGESMVKRVKSTETSESQPSN